MFKHYTMKVNGKDFLDSQGLLSKVIFLARKEYDNYFILLELRITDKTIYFNEKNINLNESIDYLEEFKSILKPTSIPSSMVKESDELEMKLFKNEFNKRCDYLLNQYSGLARQS